MNEECLFGILWDSDSDSDEEDDDEEDDEEDEDGNDQVHRREEEVANEAAERIRRAEMRRRPPW